MNFILFLVLVGIGGYGIGRSEIENKRKFVLVIFYLFLSFYLGAKLF